MGTKIDLTGHKYGRLTVVKEAGKSKHSKCCWECMCDCGKIHITTANNLRRGGTKSCGCYNKEIVSRLKTKHSMSNSAEYSSWKSMIKRCYNPNNANYYRYGARGIYVCNRWRYSFQNFLKDMGLKPLKKRTIERIDNNSGYEPNNCIWADYKTQARNRRLRKGNISGKSGVTWNKQLSMWRVNIGVNYKRMNIGCFKDLKEAIDARTQAEHVYWNV